MSSVEAINSADITKIGVGVIIAVVVVGILLSLIITAIIGRLVVVAVVIVVGVLVWQQRTSIENKINAHKCDLQATFFGMHVDAPASVKQACRSASS